MAVLVFKCPHCRTERMSFDIQAQSNVHDGGGVIRTFCHLQCRNCGRPAAAEIGGTGGLALTDLRSAPGGLIQLGLTIERVWPAIPTPAAPEHLPDAVLRAYLAAEQTFPMEGQEEATAGSYGRALDIGTKAFAPDLAGVNLAPRIDRLAEAHRITAELAAWAHEIRLIRNNALHAPEGVTREELEAIRGFTEMVLTYLFTLPGMLAARRAQATPPLGM